MSKPTTRDQLIEAAQAMEDGMIRLQMHRDAWQNDLLWWICKSVKLLLEAEVRRRDDRERGEDEHRVYQTAEKIL